MLAFAGVMLAWQGGAGGASMVLIGGIALAAAGLAMLGYAIWPRRSEGGVTGFAWRSVLRCDEPTHSERGG